MGAEVPENSDHRADGCPSGIHLCRPVVLLALERERPALLCCAALESSSGISWAKSRYGFKRRTELVRRVPPALPQLRAWRWGVSSQCGRRSTERSHTLCKAPISAMNSKFLVTFLVMVWISRALSRNPTTGCWSETERGFVRETYRGSVGGGGSSPGEQFRIWDWIRLWWRGRAKHCLSLRVGSVLGQGPATEGTECSWKTSAEQMPQSGGWQYHV